MRRSSAGSLPPRIRNGRHTIVHGLQSRLHRQDAAFAARLHGEIHHRKRAGNMSDAAVKPEFAHHDIISEFGKIALSGCGYYAYRYREIVSAAVFMHVGRSEIYDYFSAGNMESPGLQCGHCSQQAFFHRGVGKPYEMYTYPLHYVYFNSHRHRLYAYALGSVYIYHHFLFCGKNGHKNALRSIRNVKEYKKRKNVAERNYFGYIPNRAEPLPDMDAYTAPDSYKDSFMAASSG